MSRRLADSALPDRKSDPTLALDTTRAPQQVPEGEQLADVYLTVAVRTSAGPGPGHKRLPPAEANLLVARKHAVAGTEPPRSYLGEPEPSARPFDDNHNAQGSRHDAGLRR